MGRARLAGHGHRDARRSELAALRWRHVDCNAESSNCEPDTWSWAASVAQGHQDPQDAPHHARRRDDRPPRRASRTVRRRPRGGSERAGRRSLRLLGGSGAAEATQPGQHLQPLTGGWRRTWASIPTSTRYATTAPPNCCPLTSISGRWPGRLGHGDGPTSIKPLIKFSSRPSEKATSVSSSEISTYTMICRVT